jgi:hypothetical protein
MKKGIENLEAMNPNFLSTRSYVEMLFSTMIGAVQRLYRNNAPDQIDYIACYLMGILKNEIFYPSQSIQTNAYVSCMGGYLLYIGRQLELHEVPT